MRTLMKTTWVTAQVDLSWADCKNRGDATVRRDEDECVRMCNHSVSCPQPGISYASLTFHFMS